MNTWTEERRSRAKKTMKAAQNRPDVREGNRLKATQYWSVEENRKNASVQKKAQCEIPEVRAAIKAARGVQWKNPVYRKAKRAGVLCRREEALAECQSDEERRRLKRRHEHADRYRSKMGRDWE